MDTVQLLDQLAQARELRTDYQIAKYLGISTQRVSKYRAGTTLGDELALRIAADLQLDQGAVLSAMAAERAQLPEVKRAWAAAARRLAQAALVVVALYVAPVTLPGADNAQASAGQCLLCQLALSALLLGIALILFGWNLDRRPDTPPRPRVRRLRTPV